MAFCLSGNPAGPQAEDVGELAGVRRGWDFHNPARHVKRLGSTWRF